MYDNDVVLRPPSLKLRLGMPDKAHDKKTYRYKSYGGRSQAASEEAHK